MSTTLRRTAAALIAVGVLLLLSGCLSIDAKLSLDRDARASGTLTLLISKQLASIVGLTSTDALESAIRDSDGQDAPGFLSGGGDFTVRETDSDFAVDVTLDGVPLDDEDSMIATVNEAGDQVTFTYTNTAEDQDTSGMDVAGGLGRVTLEVDFPGPVLEATGAGVQRVDSDTVRWDFPLTEATVATATSGISSSTPASSAGTGLALAGGAAVVVAGVVVVGLMVRRGRSGQPESPAVTGAGGEGPGGEGPADPGAADPGAADPGPGEPGA